MELAHGFNSTATIPIDDIPIRRRCLKPWSESRYETDFNRSRQMERDRVLYGRGSRFQGHHGCRRASTSRERSRRPERKADGAAQIFRRLSIIETRASWALGGFPRKSNDRVRTCPNAPGTVPTRRHVSYASFRANVNVEMDHADDLFDRQP